MLIAVISSLVSAASGFATAAVDSPAVASVQASTFVADSPVVAPRAVRAIRLARPPVIDGSLSDELWLDADRVTGFLQRDPDEGTQPTEGTVVHVVYDDAALYIGARMHDAHPDSIIARLGRRDALTNSDAFTVFIDPYHDRRSGYYFGVNAAGTLSDGTLYNDEWEDNSWDGVWEGNVTRDSLGWTAELRIPYSQLRFIHRPEYLWESTSSERSRARTSVPISSTRPRTVAASFHASSTWWGSAGHAAAAPRGAAVHHRQGGILAAPAADPFHDSSKLTPGLGAGARFGLGPNRTLNAQTFFQEKRPFFIEGSSIFNFGRGVPGKDAGPVCRYVRRCGGDCDVR